MDRRWLASMLVRQFEFVEWNPNNHLRHARFIGLREDRSAEGVHANRTKADACRSMPEESALRAVQS
ncbi:MAG TPA: hypothetical protein VK789_16210 [Bryobacteraceae bacterium]|jgi:ATP-dependent DNA ligase|nr:hypothetical protein [Bryobacteraceae bacterium]